MVVLSSYQYLHKELITLLIHVNGNPRWGEVMNGQRDFFEAD